MSENNVLDGIMEALNGIGLYYDLEDLEDITLEEALEDSVAFVSFIVELEAVFGIEIPDEYLLLEKLPDFSAVQQMIERLMDDSMEEADID